MCRSISKSNFNYLGLEPDIILPEGGLMHGIGELGTGDLQISIKSMDDFEQRKVLIDRAYYIN